ncbi:MAG TPA: nuclear transport factor 2 family protein [Acidimicrobiales bacterium]|nr:nuclear transport factor 2 family protein [Acidimicrobiales bacterium]
MSATNEPYSEIAMLVHKYADAVVHRNGEQWSSTWAEDAVWDLGGGRLVEGLDAIKQLWYGAMKGFEATIQTVLNGGVEINPSGNAASGRWYIQEQVVRANGDRGILLAHYDDEYVLTTEGWKFSRRFLQPHYSGPYDLSGEFQCSAEKLRERNVEGVDV